MLSPKKIYLYFAAGAYLSEAQNLERREATVHKAGL